MHDQLHTNGDMPKGGARGHNRGLFKICFDGGGGGSFMELFVFEHQVHVHVLLLCDFRMQRGDTCSCQNLDLYNNSKSIGLGYSCLSGHFFLVKQIICCSLYAAAL